MTVQDWAAQRCTISYRAPELFNVESHCIIDERTDIWVSNVRKGLNVCKSDLFLATFSNL